MSSYKIFKALFKNKLASGVKILFFQLVLTLKVNANFTIVNKNNTITPLPNPHNICVAPGRLSIGRKIGLSPCEPGNLKFQWSYDEVTQKIYHSEKIYCWEIDDATSNRPQKIVLGLCSEDTVDQRFVINHGRILASVNTDLCLQAKRMTGSGYAKLKFNDCIRNQVWGELESNSDDLEEACEFLRSSNVDLLDVERLCGVDAGETDNSDDPGDSDEEYAADVCPIIDYAASFLETENYVDAECNEPTKS